MTKATADRLSLEELGAWRAFLRAHSFINRKLEAELLAEHELPLASYDVLLQLAESEDRCLRMTELADRVLLSRSGLTRLVDRLERDGLVKRQACLNDARGTLAVLTDRGLERLRGAAPTHLRGISEHVTSRLTPAELEELKRLMLKLGDPSAQPPADGCGTAEGVR